MPESCWVGTKDAWPSHCALLIQLCVWQSFRFGQRTKYMMQIANQSKSNHAVDNATTVV